MMDYLKNSDAFREFITPELEKHINGWAKRCHSGQYVDLPDVSMYDYEGCDSDGLDMCKWRQSSRCENLHQKMNIGCGFIGMGVETAHNLQVILVYKYLINASVTICIEPDFGHTHHHLEDRIQHQISEIFGIELFTNRINVSESKPLEFTVVVVAPLNLSEDYMEKKEP